MLVLSRKPGEKLVIAGNITISVVQVIGGRVKIGIEAPDDVTILRGELVAGDEAVEAKTEEPAWSSEATVEVRPGSPTRTGQPNDSFPHSRIRTAMERLRKVPR